MATENQIAANRENAKKSTGPRTPGGKYVSSQNAVTHGLFAESVLLPHESEERFRALHAAYLNAFPPDSQETLDLVETVTVSRWRLRRIWTIEAANLTLEQRAQSDSTQDEDPPTKTALAVRALSLPPRSLEALSRHEARCHRAYNQALDRLIRIQAAKRKSDTTNPISDGNKGLTPDKKPIQPPTNQGRTGDRTGVEPDESQSPLPESNS
jgi:CRISPR/Cas system-associated endonuclease Cas1